jgi:hypothetical protein
MQWKTKTLLEQLKNTIRLRHYSYKTEKSYIDWIRRYIFFYDKRHSQDMRSVEIEVFLTHLAFQKASLSQLKIKHEVCLISGVIKR